MYLNQSRLLLDLRFLGILLFTLEARFRRKTLEFLEDADLIIWSPTTERILTYRAQHIFEGRNCHRYGE